MTTVRVVPVMVWVLTLVCGAGDALVDGAAGHALMVSVLQGMIRFTVPLVMSTLGALQVFVRVWVCAWVVVGGSGCSPSPVLVEGAAGGADGDGGAGGDVGDVVGEGAAGVVPGNAEGEGAVGGDDGWMVVSLVMLTVRVLSVMLRVVPMLRAS